MTAQAGGKQRSAEPIKKSRAYRLVKMMNRESHKLVAPIAGGRDSPGLPARDSQLISIYPKRPGITDTIFE